MSIPDNLHALIESFKAIVKSGTYFIGSPRIGEVEVMTQDNSKYRFLINEDADVYTIEFNVKPAEFTFYIRFDNFTKTRWDRILDELPESSQAVFREIKTLVDADYKTIVNRKMEYLNALHAYQK